MSGAELVFRLTRLMAGLAAATVALLAYSDAPLGWWLIATSLAAAAATGMWIAGNLWARRYGIVTRLGGWDVVRIDRGRGFAVTIKNI